MSSLYTRVFLQILDSSIAEDYRTRHIFEDLLKLADRQGVIDMTKGAIARRINVPEDEVAQAITKLEAPDPNSRDPKKEGRRIERLSDHRDWGWRIINWAEYEAIRDRAAANERLIRHRQKKKEALANGTTEPGEPAAVPKFSPPTEAEVILQCNKIGLPELEGKKFFAYYDELGWKNKTGPVRDWHKRLTRWKLEWESRGRQGMNPSEGKPRTGPCVGGLTEEEMLRQAQ